MAITDMKDPQAAYDRLSAELGSEKVLFPNVLRLSTNSQAKAWNAAIRHRLP